MKQKRSSRRVQSPSTCAALKRWAACGRMNLPRTTKTLPRGLLLPRDSPRPPLRTGKSSPLTHAASRLWLQGNGARWMLCPRPRTKRLLPLPSAPCTDRFRQSPLLALLPPWPPVAWSSTTSWPRGCTGLPVMRWLPATTICPRTPWRRPAYTQKPVCRRWQGVKPLSGWRSPTLLMTTTTTRGKRAIHSMWGFFLSLCMFALI